MDDQLLRGNRTVKSNSSGLDAFESPNFPPLAKLEIGIRFKQSIALSPPMGRFTVHTHFNTNVAVWRSESDSGNPPANAGMPCITSSLLCVSQ
jgi:L-asparaginase/Glu-tRNA(Gln) amidotransferase subunit D